MYVFKRRAKNYLGMHFLLRYIGEKKTLSTFLQKNPTFHSNKRLLLTLYLMTDFGTDGADARAVYQPTGVAVIPVLVSKLSLGHSEGTELVVQVFSLLEIGEGEGWGGGRRVGGGGGGRGREGGKEGGREGGRRGGGRRGREEGEGGREGGREGGYTGVSIIHAMLGKLATFTLK